MSDRIDPATPTLAYATPRLRRRRGLFLAVLLWSVAILPFAIILHDHLVIILPLLRSHAIDPRIRDAGHLRQIGQAILMYSNEYHGQFPDRLPTLLLTEDVYPNAFVATLAADTPATGPTTQAAVATMDLGHHLSWVYLGRGWNISTVKPEMVVAFGPYNSTTGMNVLFGDGHVQWYDAQTMSKLIAGLPQSTGPTTMP